MGGGRSRVVFSLGGFWLLCVLVTSAYGYDPLDPNGNITIKWDLVQENGGTHDVRVSIYNYQLYRHIEEPGWKLSWAWLGDEVIWSISGAEAAEQGNCSKIKGPLPHCCERSPTIIDLLPGTPYNKQTANCCKGGVLASMLQDIEKSAASFQMNTGIPPTSTGVLNRTSPVNFTLGIRGYTCGDPVEVPPSKFSEDQGRRRTQAIATWNVTCSYSQFQAASSPTCCVSLSAFYDQTIVPCPKCSCACQGNRNKCVKPGELPPVLELPQNELLKPVVQCSQHMCPTKVHWHVKQSYKEYWRVKMTVTNFNFIRNYSQWNVVVQHPNLRSVVQVFSFNYRALQQYGQINDSGIFYGVQHYNDMLLQSGESGNVQTEMLMRKDAGIFTFRGGWAFPRKISFNGEECVMPPPDEYPRLPNSEPKTRKFCMSYKC